MGKTKKTSKKKGGKVKPPVLDGGNKPQNRPKPKASPFQGASNQDLAWVIPGKIIAEYWKDKRLFNKKLDMTFNGSPDLVVLKFTFDIENDLGIGYLRRNLDGPGYLAFRQERKMNHLSSQEEESWNALIKKLQTRVGLTEELVKPDLFGAKAKSLVLSFLTSFERALMDQSQKDWSLVDEGKLSTEHKKYGGSTLKKRSALLKTVLEGGPPTEPTFSGIENTPKRTKDVSIMIRKDVSIINVDASTN